MGLDVVYGATRNRQAATQLSSELESTVEDGTVYLGYPVISSPDGDNVIIDALLVSRDHGLAAFVFADVTPATEADWKVLVAEQDRLFGALESHLGRHDSLRRGRRLALTIETVTVFPAPTSNAPEDAEGRFCSVDEVGSLVATFKELDSEISRALNAAIQRVTTIKPVKKRSNVKRDNSRGAVLKEIEKGIANLDKWQRQAAIETPDGPQRIRGLAGSGKTIVLALKAVYLHGQYPDWQIAITFFSRALYQQFEDLVTRFSFEQSNDRPDFSKLQLLHGWGSTGRDGLYSLLARHVGITPRDFAYARATFGRDAAFQGVCRELLTAAEEGKHRPIFDAVLIDEAQDFPPEFFRLIYRFTKEPKRIIWAFDELQRLSETAMPSTAELFGTTPTEDPLVSLAEKADEPRRDIVLPVCYRNSPWSLATAHAVGLGVYRDGGLVQHLDDPDLWTDIGYSIVAGTLEPGQYVELERSASSYPEYFKTFLDSSDAVALGVFENEAEQDDWVARQIATNLKKDELEHDDILVVLPETYTAKRRSARFASVLDRHGIGSHLAGVHSSVDELFMRNSIAMAHIHRAKGNEAPMVYVLDSQFAAKTPNQITRRNTLFTAVTRSRAWVRICGWGEGMSEIADEVQAVRDAAFRLKFTIPTMERLAEMRRIHRDRSEAEMASLKRATKSAKELLDAFDRGEIEIDDLPPALRTRLARLVREELEDAADE